jgi:quercetin dioxygenase-like cupin family protein
MRSLLAADHPFVVRRSPDRFLRIGQGSAADDASIDPRDEGAIHRLLSASTVASKYCLGLSRMAPNEYHAKHHHPRGDEFYYFLDGEALVYLDGRTVRANRGTAIHIPAGCIHAILNDTEADAELLWGVNAGEYRDVGLEYDE